MIIQSSNPQDILSLLHYSQYDRHMHEWRWYKHVTSINPNFFADIAQRQADKRAAGIGSEGLCHA